MVEQASMVVLRTPRSVTEEKIERIANAIGQLEGKVLTKGENLKLLGVTLDVVNTSPPGEVIVGIETGFEILSGKFSGGSDVVLAIDRSYSMKNRDYSPTRFEAGIEAINAFLENKVDSADRVSVVTFAFDATTAQEFQNITDDLKAEIMSKLRETRLGGRTSLGGVIEYSLGVFESQGFAGNDKVMIVLTDGVDNIGIDPESMAKKAGKSGVKIYTVLVGVSKHYHESKLKKIAELSGGKFYYKKDTEELKKLYSELAKT